MNGVYHMFGESELFRLPAVHHCLSAKAVEHAIHFACNCLGMRHAPSWSILRFDRSQRWSAVYIAAVHHIQFNGRPVLDTVFHEMIHHMQNLRGDDLKTAYSSISSFKEYYESPYEVEAREKAAFLVSKYLGPTLASWDNPTNETKSLRSDHTYY